MKNTYLDYASTLTIGERAGEKYRLYDNKMCTGGQPELERKDNPIAMDIDAVGLPFLKN